LIDKQHMRYFIFTVFAVFSFFAMAQPGGENQQSATLIPALPFVGSGSTTNALDDYSESCPDYPNAGGGKDHVYRFNNGPVDQYVRVSVCEAVTDYDSQLYVYVDSCYSGSNIACQEDGCQSPAYSNNYNSVIEPLLLEANRDYYFVIDGYSANASGNYQINIDTVPAPPTAIIPFSNETSTLLDPANRDTYSGAPVAVVDLNNDGFDDIIRLNGTDTMVIDYNQPTGFFTSYHYGEVSSSSVWAMAVADFNGDSIQDIMIGSYVAIRLIPGINGGNAFGPPQTISTNYIFSQGINFADIDVDGDIDIFACNDVGESHIYLNDGQGNFTQSWNTIDMSTNPVSDKSGNYASIWTDYDNDGDLDLYITKCRQGVTDPNDGRRINQLFQNDGQGNYTEVANQAGLRMGAQSWVTDFGDIDNDGDFDAFVMHHDAPSQLMLNQNGTFIDITSVAGISNISFAGIQCLFRDFNNDGYVDLLATGGQHRMYVNNGDGTFTEDINGFVDQSNWMLSCAVGDLDRDGYLDVVGTYGNLYNYPNSKSDKVWINQDSGNHYLRVSLEGDALNFRGIGAKIEIAGPWGTQVREVRSGEGYGIMNSYIQHFGLGSQTLIDSVNIFWPDGTLDQLISVDGDQQITVSKGSHPVKSTVVYADSVGYMYGNEAEIFGRLKINNPNGTEIRLIYTHQSSGTTDSIVYPTNSTSGIYPLLDTIENIQTGELYSAYYKSVQSSGTSPIDITVSDTLYFATAGLGVDDLEDLYRVYPNPASEFLYVRSKDSSLQQIHYKIFDAKGRIVLENPVHKISSPIDLRSLSDGAYWIQFSGHSDGFSMEKIILQKTK